jgi:minimal PKS chain-length factor (CLF/KS beta)
MTKPMDAVVTGLGVVAPNGIGAEAYWNATLSGSGAIRPIEQFDATSYPCRIAGEIVGFVADDHLPARLLPQTDRMTRIALVSADWALEDADLRPAEHPEYAMSVATASSSGGFEFGQRELQKLWAHGPGFVSAYQSFAWFYAVNTGQISIRHGMRGPSGVMVGEQAAGLDVLGHARRLIRAGSEVVVTGGVDSDLCPWGWVAMMTSGRISAQNDPDRAYLPFDVDAGGHVPGEGGAILVVEDAAVAARRGVRRPYGRIAGHCATFDSAAGRSGLRRAVSGALDDARLRPEEIDVVFADAAAVPSLDRIEAEAIGAVFGPRGVPVTVPRTMTGRLGSGGGPLDVVTALLCIRDGIIPPTINVHRPNEDHAIDLVTSPREGPVRAALAIGRGTGGFNSAVVVTSP